MIAAAVQPAALIAPLRGRVASLLRTGDSFVGRAGGDLALVQAGRLAVELSLPSGSVLCLARLEPGALAIPLDTLATPAFALCYRAEQPTRLSWLSAGAVEADAPGRAARSYEALLGAAVRQLNLLACLPAAHRLYAELLRLDAAASPLPSHGELAQRLCTTRETVSREMSLLRREGIVTGERVPVLARPEALLTRLARALNLDDAHDAAASIGL